MEILILGDSVPFGRPKYGIYRHLTWPYLLRKELDCHLQVRAKGGSTTIDAVKEARDLNSYWFGGTEERLFDVTFIQVGVVDCCPRLVPQRLHDYARRVPGFRRLERSPRAHSFLARPWTSEAYFCQALSDLIMYLQNISRASFFVEIAKPANYLIKNVGDFSEIVNNYNGLIEKTAGSQSLVQWQVPNSGEIHLLPDGHHLTELGHQAVAKACLNKYQKAL